MRSGGTAQTAIDVYISLPAACSRHRTGSGQRPRRTVEMDFNISPGTGAGDPSDEGIHAGQIDAVVGRPVSIDDTGDVLSAFSASFRCHSDMLHSWQRQSG